MAPSLGGRMPATMRPSVDLPQPLSPTSPTTSPLAMERSTPSTAWTTSSFTGAPRRLAPPSREVEPREKRRDTPRSSMTGRAAPSPAPGVSWTADALMPPPRPGCRVDAAREAARRYSAIGGGSAQGASARGQRERKAQPAGRFSKEGVMPGSGAAARRRRLRLGTLPMRPTV
jgi:hypothetical protein